MIRNVKYFFWRVKALLKWIKVIWNLGHGDYSYAIDVFQFQLSILADELEKWVGNDYDSQRIRTAVKLMDKIYGGEYENEWDAQIREKYGENVMDSTFEPTKNGSMLRWEYESWDNKEEVAEELTRLIHKSYEKQEKAHRVLWKLIDRNIRNWWV